MRVKSNGRRNSLRALVFHNDRYSDNEAGTHGELVGDPGPEQPSRLVIRHVTIDDAAFILDSWCSSYRHSQVVKDVDDDVYKIEQRALIHNLVPRCRILIACDEDSFKHIKGYVVYEPPVGNGLAMMHYICVHISLQRRGIGTALVRAMRDDINGTLDERSRKTHSQVLRKFITHQPYPKGQSPKKDYPSQPVWITHYTNFMKRLSKHWFLMYNPYLLSEHKKVANEAHQA